MIWMHTANENLSIHVIRHQHKSTGQWKPCAKNINISTHSEGTNTQNVENEYSNPDLKPNQREVKIQTRGFTHTTHLKNKSAPGLRTREAASEPYECVTELKWQNPGVKYETETHHHETRKHAKPRLTSTDWKTKGLEEGKKHTAQPWTQGWTREDPKDQGPRLYTVKKSCFNLK